MIETNAAYISKVDDDTIKVILKQNTTLTREEYQSFESIYFDLLGIKENIKFLIIIEDGTRIEMKFLNFFQDNYKTNFKGAEAYLIKNPRIKMFFSVGKKIIQKKRDYPLREFETEQEALSWLKSLDKL